MAGKHDVRHLKHNGVIVEPAAPRVQLGVPFVGRVDSHQFSKVVIGKVPSFGPPQRTAHVELTIAAIYADAVGTEKKNVARMMWDDTWQIWRAVTLLEGLSYRRAFPRNVVSCR